MGYVPTPGKSPAEKLGLLVKLASNRVIGKVTNRYDASVHFSD